MLEATMYRGYIGSSIWGSACVAGSQPTWKNSQLYSCKVFSCVFFVPKFFFFFYNENKAKYAVQSRWPDHLQHLGLKNFPLTL